MLALAGATAAAGADDGIIGVFVAAAGAAGVAGAASVAAAGAATGATGITVSAHGASTVVVQPQAASLYVTVVLDMLAGNSVYAQLEVWWQAQASS